MMYLYENLTDKALELIDTKSTLDNIKAEKDMLLINNMINAVNISSEYINEGIMLDKKLNDEYPEIQLLCDAANTMQNAVGINSKEIVCKTAQKSIVDVLTIDYFGLLASVLVKHQVISTVKDFICAVD